MVRASSGGLGRQRRDNHEDRGHLSVVGAERSPHSGYMRAKVAQEKAIKAATVPYTIVRATQFFEFIGSIADGSTEGQTVRLPPVLMQPMAADDVAAGLADVAVARPLNGTVELAGPEAIRLDELARRLLSAKRDPRQVSTDVKAGYFGAELDDRSLHARQGSTHRPDPLRRLAQPLLSQVKGGKETTLTPGQTFYEGPDDVHVVGRNASSTKPAKFLVLLIKDKGAPVLTVVE